MRARRAASLGGGSRGKGGGGSPPTPPPARRGDARHPTAGGGEKREGGPGRQGERESQSVARPCVSLGSGGPRALARRSQCLLAGKRTPPPPSSDVFASPRRPFVFDLWSESPRRGNETASNASGGRGRVGSAVQRGLGGGVREENPRSPPPQSLGVRLRVDRGDGAFELRERQEQAPCRIPPGRGGARWEEGGGGRRPCIECGEDRAARGPRLTGAPRCVWQRLWGAPSPSGRPTPRHEPAFG